MLNNFEFVEYLCNAYPKFQSLVNSTIVIKYGGSAMKENRLKYQVIDDIVFLFFMGVKVVLVHGGGPMINKWLSKVNIKPRFKDGIRMTDLDTMEIVEMVLSGKVNKSLVALINQRNVSAVGLSGKDSNLLIASKLNTIVDDYVGQIQSVNSRLLEILLNQGYIPVISSVASDCSGVTYNINADSAAGFIASSLKSSKLILLTDTPGIMLDINDSSTLMHDLDLADIDQLKDKSIISGGMIPKVDCCTRALKQGVQATYIIDGRVQHSLLLSLLTDENIGSVITL